MRPGESRNRTISQLNGHWAETTLEFPRANACRLRVWNRFERAPREMTDGGNLNPVDFSGGGLQKISPGASFLAKPKLLVVELWGVSDLMIATPFLQEACALFEVTLLAKPFARELRVRFWPEIKVIPFNAPWTRFGHKFNLWSWPWGSLVRLVRQLRERRIEFVVSARGDPLDHCLARLAGAKARLGFPSFGRAALLTTPLARPDPHAHRYEYWRILGRRLGFDLPPVEQIDFPSRPKGRTLAIHTGAGRNVRVWPLTRYLAVARRLRERKYAVKILCDSEQRRWWLEAGERDVITPESVTELKDQMEDAAAFVGNDSGPGHVAAALGIPTFTIFGPQLPGWYLPLHPAARYAPGKACPYKPCFDDCRFPLPHCLVNLGEEEVLAALENFLESLKLGQSSPRAAT
jgi:ADP-heptose:LPS heptosyltransferase